MAYQRPRSLKDLLVRALIRLPENITYEGSRQCGRQHRKTCAHVRTDTDFTSADTGDKFSASKTSNIIYLVQYRKGIMQYVGETKNLLHLRMNGHRSNYYCRLPDKPAARHFFNTPGHTFEDVTVMIIKLLHSADSMRRKYRESYWIYTLRTLTPDGLTLELSTVS